MLRIVFLAYFPHGPARLTLGLCCQEVAERRHILTLPDYASAQW